MFFAASVYPFPPTVLTFKNFPVFFPPRCFFFLATFCPLLHTHLGEYPIQMPEAFLPPFPSGKGLFFLATIIPEFSPPFPPPFFRKGTAAFLLALFTGSCLLPSFWHPNPPSFSSFAAPFFLFPKYGYLSRPQAGSGGTFVAALFSPLFEFNATINFAPPHLGCR